MNDDVASSEVEADERSSFLIYSRHPWLHGATLCTHCVVPCQPQQPRGHRSASRLPFGRGFLQSAIVPSLLRFQMTMHIMLMILTLNFLHVALVSSTTPELIASTILSYFSFRIDDPVLQTKYGKTHSDQPRKLLNIATQ